MCCLHTSSLIFTSTAFVLPVSHPFTQTGNKDLQLVFSQSTHQPTQHLYLYTSGFSSRLCCTTEHKRPSLEEPFIMHSRIGLACRRALITLRTAAMKPRLTVRSLCSMLPWHSMVAAPCQVPLHSCSASSDLVLVLCDTCGEWTSGAGLGRRLVDP